MSGHQPQLFHPGVWIKNFALDSISRIAGGVGINLVVDNDLCADSAILCPQFASQGSVQLVKYAPFPSVAAPYGMTLGGGCEIAMHTSKQIIANDTFAGLVEVGVGLLPAGGGTKELALRAYDLAAQGERADPLPFLQKMFMRQPFMVQVLDLEKALANTVM